MNQFSIQRNPVLSFHRWTRKGYAVFDSLHQVVRIAVITFACTLTQLSYEPVMAEAQDSTRSAGKVDLDEVEVTGDQPVGWSGNARLVQVTDRREINASPARSLDDLLETIAGVDVRQRGGDGVQADVSIRGGSFDQVLILLNGVNITDPQTGHFSMDLPVDLSQIKRIELLQGPNARLYGPHAYSGVVNIVTGQETTEAGKHLKVQFGGGSFGFLQGGLTADFNGTNRNTTLSFSSKHSDGYRTNTDFDFLNANLTSRFHSEKLGNLQFQAGYQQKAFGANSFYTFLYPNQFERGKTLFSSLNWDKDLGKIRLSAQLGERIHHDRFELFRNMEGAASWYTGHNYHLTYVTTGNVMLRSYNALGKTTAGMEIRNEHILSNVLGETMASPVKDFIDDSGMFTKSKTRTNYRLFADHTVYWQGLKLSGGFSGNLNSDFGPYFTGGTDASYRLTEALDLSAGINHSLRLPTFNDLYYKSSKQLGNPDLKPEQATTAEVGAQFHPGKFFIQGTGYYRMGHNVIDWVSRSSAEKYVSRNETELNALGGELTAGYRCEKGFVRAARVSFSGLGMDRQAKGYDSMYALDFLRKKMDLHLEHAVASSPSLGEISACWNYSWLERAGTYMSPATGQLTAYSPFALTDVRLSWQKGIFRAYCDLDNLFDVSYADLGGLTQAGRSIRATLQVAL